MSKEKRDFKGVWIPKEIWLDKKLSWIEKLFLTEINSLDNDNGCFASNNYFSRFFDLSAGRCSQIVNTLIDKKYIYAEYEKEGKRVIKRVLRILNRGIKYSKQGIKNIKQGYLENDEDNNTLSNNTVIKDIIEYLNLKAGKGYKSNTDKTKSFIKARLNEGFKIDDFKKVIDTKCSQWLNNEMNMYLRPETLFGTKFEGYLNEKPKIDNKYNNKDLEVVL